MGYCLNTILKAQVPMDDPTYLDKGEIYYDSNFGDAEAGRNIFNTLGLFSTNIENLDDSIFEIDNFSDTLDIRIKSDVAVPANYTRKMYYKLSEVTIVRGANGTLAQDIVSYSKFRMRMKDLARCVNVTKCELSSLAFTDVENPNIEALSTLIKCAFISIAGKALNDWRGDIVTFIDQLVANGYNVTTNPVFVLGMQGYAGQLCQLTVNGNQVFSAYDKNTHIVFTDSNHYKIYKNISSVTPLDDYSAYTPIYTK